MWWCRICQVAIPEPLHTDGPVAAPYHLLGDSMHALTGEWQPVTITTTFTRVRGQLVETAPEGGSQ